MASRSPLHHAAQNRRTNWRGVSLIRLTLLPATSGLPLCGSRLLLLGAALLLGGRLLRRPSRGLGEAEAQPEGEVEVFGYADGLHPDHAPRQAAAHLKLAGARAGQGVVVEGRVDTDAQVSAQNAA